MVLLLISGRPELIFVFEENKQLSSSISLENPSENHVAFKFNSTNPGRYGVQPRIGILPPGTSCEVTVKMRAPRKAPTNMRCKDKFMIQSVIARPGTTTQDAPNLFKEEVSHTIEESKLRVVYTLPQAQAGHDSIESSLAITSEVIGSIGENQHDDLQVDESGSIVKESAPRVVHILEWGRNIPIGTLILKGFISILITVVLYYLMKQTFSLIWYFTTLVAIWMMKMVKKLVSDSIEDWILKTLLCILMPFFYKYKERLRRSTNI